MFYKTLFSALLIFMAVLIFAQNELKKPEFIFEINNIYAPLSISKEALSNAKTLNELNAYFKKDWVSKYNYVKVQTWHKGKLRVASSENDLFTEEQKSNLLSHDAGSSIKVEMNYYPKNSLKHNLSHISEIEFIVNPDTNASFSMGNEILNQYLKESAFDKIDLNQLREYALVAVKFRVDKNGVLRDIHVSESSRDGAIDNIMLDAICNMLDWVPAEYEDGTKVDQEFVFTVGDMRSCVVNTLNIDRSVNRSKSN